MRTREVSTRDFKKMLREMGFKFARQCNGSHEIWKTNDGQSFSFPTQSRQVKAGLVWQFQRMYC